MISPSHPTQIFKSVGLLASAVSSFYGPEIHGLWLVIVSFHRMNIICLVWSGLVLSCLGFLVLSGLVWSGLVWSCLVRSDLAPAKPQLSPVCKKPAGGEVSCH